MEYVFLIDFSDLLYTAVGIRYGWNQAHELLKEVYPYYGVKTVYKSELDEIENKDARKILEEFFNEQPDLKKFSIKPK